MATYEEIKDVLSKGKYAKLTGPKQEDILLVYYHKENDILLGYDNYNMIHIEFHGNDYDITKKWHSEYCVKELEKYELQEVENGFISVDK